MYDLPAASRHSCKILWQFCCNCLGKDDNPGNLYRVAYVPVEPRSTEEWQSKAGVGRRSRFRSRTGGCLCVARQASR